MDRRTSLRYMAAVMGTSIIIGDGFLTSCKAKNEVSTASRLDFGVHKDLLQKIGNIIIPAGGKHIGFEAIKDIDTSIAILNDCMSPEDQTLVMAGFANFISNLKTDSDLQTKINELDLLCYSQEESEEKNKVIYFKNVKDVILLTYFTHEKVVDGVFEHIKVPGKYEGAVLITEDRYQPRFGMG